MGKTLSEKILGKKGRIMDWIIIFIGLLLAVIFILVAILFFKAYFFLEGIKRKWLESDRIEIKFKIKD